MAGKKKKERRFICNDHDDIKENAERILKEFDKFQTPYQMKLNIKRYAKEIIKLVKDAKDSGISMESRLYEYKQAIENLGFERFPKKY